MVKDTSLEFTETFFEKEVGINEAASITQRGKGQISRDSNSGRLTYTLNDKGQKRYKVADLFQLYGLKKPKETGCKIDEIPTGNMSDTSDNTVALAVLQERVLAYEKAMQRMELEIMDLRQNRDKQLETIQRLTLLLPSLKTTTQEVQPVESPAKRSFWKRFFS